MKLRMVKRMECPPESGGKMGFRYTHSEDGHISHARDERSWLKAISQHCRDNGYAPVAPEDAFDQLCKLLPPGWCRYENGENPKWFVEMRITVWDVLRGTKVLLAELMAGAPLVDKQLAISRSLACSRCPFNVPISGCAPCVGLSSLIETVGGVIKTPSDPVLKSCIICGCSNRAQTRLPIEILAKGVTPEQRTQYATVPFCWKGNELAAIDSGPPSS